MIDNKQFWWLGSPKLVCWHLKNFLLGQPMEKGKRAIEREREK
jgi:hypothetical protein